MGGKPESEEHLLRDCYVDPSKFTYLTYEMAKESLAAKRKEKSWTQLTLSLKEIFERANLPWSKLEIEVDSGTILQYQFPLMPRFFLSSAKEDLAGKDARGLVNALTNAKRAIDCQTEIFLGSIGYSSKGLVKQLGDEVILSLQSYSHDPNQRLQFKVLESLGIVTSAIVEKVRRFRHGLEHEYRQPRYKDVRESIDIASLFVSACEGAMNAFLEDVHLCVGKTTHPLGNFEMPARQIGIALEDHPKPRIQIKYSNFDPWEHADVNLEPSAPEYLAFLRVLFAVRQKENIEKALGLAVETCGFSLAGKKLKVKSIDYA